jgi:phospholipid transport system substrate-binding protein
MIARRTLMAAGLSAVVAALSFDARPDPETITLTTDTPHDSVGTLILGLVQMADRGGDMVEERYGFIEPVVARTHNLPYIAEFALRRQWGTLAQDERQRFITAFQRLSVMTYAARFGNVAPDAFRFPLEVGEPDANGRVRVATAIRREGQADVSLEYFLQQEPDGWRIINIIADGVSDLALKRAEYQRVLAGGGLEGLLAELEAQTENLSKN